MAKLPVPVHGSEVLRCAARPRRWHNHQQMLDLHPKPFNKACYAAWQDGDSTDNGKPQGNQPFCQAMLVLHKELPP